MKITYKEIRKGKIGYSIITKFQNRRAQYNICHKNYCQYNLKYHVKQNTNNRENIETNLSIHGYRKISY